MYPVFSSENTAAVSACDASQGARSATENDRNGLNEIIRAELKNTGNRGDYLGFSETVSTTNLKGLDEELADAVGEAFCEFYKTWKMDHPNANTWQQVIYPITASRFSPSWTLQYWSLTRFSR